MYYVPVLSSRSINTHVRRGSRPSRLMRGTGADREPGRGECTARWPPRRPPPEARNASAGEWRLAFSARDRGWVTSRMSHQKPVTKHVAKKPKTVGFEPTWAPLWARGLRSPAAQALSDDTYSPPPGHWLSVTRRLGSGAYGTVHEAVNEQTRRKVALKMVDGLFGRDYDTQRLTTAVRTLRELAILRACSFHPQIVGFHACLAPSDPHNFNVLWMSLVRRFAAVAMCVRARC